MSVILLYQDFPNFLMMHLKMIRALLAMIPSQKLKVQQMDIKGVYLNRTLKEQVYMKQPKGHNGDC
jgi:Reverse transcriptase (RNA-dependent DNA polymerase)